jgi:DNA-binding CsgD family transcriptional regulator
MSVDLIQECSGELKELGSSSELQTPVASKNSTFISWDLIPQDSILERTPRELFELSPTQEVQFVDWLEKLPAEIIFENPPPNHHILEGLDLFSVASCSLSWILAHCGEKLLNALINELSRIIVESTDREPKFNYELLSHVPFVNEHLLFYHLDRYPPCTNALIMVVLKTCQACKLLTDISESSICRQKAYSSATIMELAQLYTLSRQYQKQALELYKTSFHPEAYISGSECLEVWVNKHLKHHESETVMLYTGWSGVAASTADIAIKLNCSRQNVYNHLKKADEKLSHKNAVEELQELAFCIFSEVWHTGGICSTEELIQALTAWFEWNDHLCEEGLSKILERSKTRVVVIKNGWAAISNRSCISSKAQSNKHWEYFDTEISPAAAAILDTQDIIAPVIPLNLETVPNTENEVEPEELLYQPTQSQEAILLDNWLQSGDFVWHAAGALLAHAEQLKLYPSKNAWSVAELRLSSHDYEILCNWGRLGTFSTNKLNIRKKVGAISLSGREAISLVYIVIATEIARREATEGELWPVIFKSLGDSNRDFLMMSQGFNNASPRPWLKMELERTFRTYNLRHAFDSAGTHAYVRSISLQFGFTLKGLQRLPWWLCGQQVPVAVEELIGSSSNKSASFNQMWQTFKEFRWKGIPLEEFRENLQENPWLPPAGLDNVSRAVTSKIHLLQQGEISEFSENNTSASILGAPRLAIIDGLPVFYVSLGDIWPESLQDPEYVLQFDSLNRVAVERQSDGTYCFSGGDISVPAIKQTLFVTLFSSGQPVLDEPIRYQLWSEEEEFSFYKANGWKVSEERVQSDKSPLFIICSTDIKLSFPADTLYSIFSGKARLHYFKHGIPSGFTLSLDGEPFWVVPEPTELKKKSGGIPVSPIQAVCTPIPSLWGGTARIRLSGMPVGLIPRRLLVGEMRLQMSNNAVTPTESEKFTVPPGMMVLPSRGVLIGLVQGQLQRFPVAILSKFSGVAIESPIGWSIPNSRKIIDKAELQTARLLAIPSDYQFSEWAYTEGDKFIARPSQFGDRIGQELVGLGAPLYLRKGPYNSVEAPVEISRSVVDSGVLGLAERFENGWRIALRYDLDLSSEFKVNAWYPDESSPVEIPRENWMHDPEHKSLMIKISPEHFDEPISYALSFSGICMGRSWCGASALHDMEVIITDSIDWKLTATWLAWWHVPVLAKELRDAVVQRIRKQTADTLVAWMGLTHGPTYPPCMKDVTVRMKDAIRTFFHDDLPERSKSVEVLKALELVTGDWDLDEDEAWEGYDTLLEISPVLMVHLAKSGAEALYGDKQPRVKDLLQLLRRKIAGLSDLASEIEIIEVEKGLLSTASRVMAVDEQFIQRSILEEARKLLKSERPPVRNLEFCLDIQPVRDWVTLRLLA